MQERLLPLRGLPPENQQAALLRMWSVLSPWERFTCMKLVTGGLRVGVARPLVTRALAAVAELDPKTIAQRLVGYTDRNRMPSAASFLALLAPAGAADTTRSSGTPYPFFLAHSLQARVDDFPALLGDTSQWLVEWKWDGIRAQLVRRDGDAWLWSRGEDLVTERFPEIVASARALPDGTVIDGEILVWIDEKVAPFSLLQKRIGRKAVGTKLLSEAPVILMAYDLLEYDGIDLREHPLQQRRAKLEAVLDAGALPSIRLSPSLRAADWSALARLREQSRALGVEGMLVKAADSRYGIGRTKASGVWWKWKVDPYSIDAVLVYAQPGHGKRASLYTDYTFAVWNDQAAEGSRTLVPFAKALLGADRCRSPRSRRVRPTTHTGKVRPGAKRRADTRLRIGIRRHCRRSASQKRCRRALSSHTALAQRQDIDASRHLVDPTRPPFPRELVTCVGDS
jgi:DNA ligase-1